MKSSIAGNLGSFMATDLQPSVQVERVYVSLRIAQCLYQVNRKKEEVYFSLRVAQCSYLLCKLQKVCDNGRIYSSLFNEVSVLAPRYISWRPSPPPLQCLQV